jgi:hypothetical protein
MWRDAEIECYRYRRSGELLFLDQFGQCVEETEVGAMPADFQSHYQRCTGVPYSHREFAELTEFTATEGDNDQDEDDDEDADEETTNVTPPPNGLSLLNLVDEWASELQVEPLKRNKVLDEARVFNAMLITELEMKCRTLLNTALCWLQ